MWVRLFPAKQRCTMTCDEGCLSASGPDAPPSQAFPQLAVLIQDLPGSALQRFGSPHNPSRLDPAPSDLAPP